MMSAQVKGIVANKGYVYGAVRIIKSQEDFSKIHFGDIIIVEELTLELLPALKDCVALVSDKGDLGSYTAKMGKEKDVPCIVATGNATSAFKDDDTVFVDAEAGVVRSE